MLNFSHLRNHMLTLAAAGLFLLPQLVTAECNCGRNSGGLLPMAEPTMAGPMMFEGAEGYSTDPTMLSGAPVIGAPAPGPSPFMVTDGAPPPGTLGQTYQRAMRPIPVDKHPRVSIVDIRVTGATDVRIYGTNEYRTKDGVTGFRDRRNADLWHFESEPLTPGVPHIYRAEARYGTGPGVPTRELYFRFVPGRIVTLDF